MNYRFLIGQNVSVENAKKASSIVSGKEPENTNKLLQIIGKCILDKKSSDEAVEQLKNGGKKTEKESKPKEESRRKEKEPSQEKGMLCNLVFLSKTATIRDLRTKTGPSRTNKNLKILDRFRPIGPWTWRNVALLNTCDPDKFLIFIFRRTSKIKIRVENKK